MKINKDLADAVMMVSFIILVLVGTTDFESGTTKTILMAVLGVTSVAAIAFRAMAMKQSGSESQGEE